MQTYETPLAEELVDLGAAVQIYAGVLVKIGRELCNLTTAEVVPLEREWRRRWDRSDPQAYRAWLREQRKRRTAPGVKPDAA